eukprot:Nk52_evm14s237 gene=Nk52_evmTU14s237
MLEKHFTTIMPVICIVILLMAVTRTEASPLLGDDDFVAYKVEQLSFPVNMHTFDPYDIHTCVYTFNDYERTKNACVLPGKKGGTVTCSIRGLSTSACESPNTEVVTFKRLSKTLMKIEGLNIPNHYTSVVSEGKGAIEYKYIERTHAQVIIVGPKNYPDLTISLTNVL